MFEALNLIQIMIYPSSRLGKDCTTDTGRTKTHAGASRHDKPKTNAPLCAYKHCIKEKNATSCSKKEREEKKRNHIIYTFRTSLSFHFSPVNPATGSLTHPGSVPTFSLKIRNLSEP